VAVKEAVADECVEHAVGDEVVELLFLGLLVSEGVFVVSG
jgi:hypothetical protein